MFIFVIWGHIVTYTFNPEDIHPTGHGDEIDETRVGAISRFGHREQLSPYPLVNFREFP